MCQPFYTWGECLCPTDRWLPNIGTEFSKEKAAENDPILERGFPQAHWILLPGWLRVYHQAMQVLHKLGSRAAPQRPGKLGRDQHTQRLKNTVGLEDLRPGAPWQIPQELRAKDSYTQVPWKSSAFPLCSPSWTWLAQTRGRKQQGDSGHCYLYLKNHLFFSLRKRRCSLSVAQEWCTYQGKRGQHSPTTMLRSMEYWLTAYWLETLKWSNLVFLIFKDGLCFKLVSVSS